MQTFSGTEYLKIDIASNYGLDKEDWDVRINWFNQNETAILKRTIALSVEADEPALFVAGVQAYKDAMEGKPSGYPISLDATSSGLQLLSVLVGCETSAKLCNVISTGHRENAYKSLYKSIVRLTGGTATIALEDVKQAIMTAYYNSTAVPKQVFGEGVTLDIFYEVLEEGAPGAWSLNQHLTALWNPYALSHEWVMPDNFHVKVKVMENSTFDVLFQDALHAVTIPLNRGAKKGKSLSANITHSVDGMIVREMTRRCSFSRDTLIKVIMALCSKEEGSGRLKDNMLKLLWDKYKKTGFLSARILDYIDDKNMGLVNDNDIVRLLKSFPEAPFDLMTVHDCFRCLPNYGNDVRQQYINILSEIAGSNMLQDIASQLRGKPVIVNKLGDISKQVLNSEYALS